MNPNNQGPSNSQNAAREEANNTMNEIEGFNEEPPRASHEKTDVPTTNNEFMMNAEEVDMADSVAVNDNLNSNSHIPTDLPDNVDDWHFYS